jgi:hypothetical protein
MGWRWQILSAVREKAKVGFPGFPGLQWFTTGICGICGTEKLTADFAEGAGRGTSPKSTMENLELQGFRRGIWWNGWKMQGPDAAAGLKPGLGAFKTGFGAGFRRV